MIDKSYSAYLRCAEFRAKQAEDVEHFYFMCVGILVCSISNWAMAFLAGVATCAIRDFLRWQDWRRK